jgi:DNA-binding HxlR family transcriptional regulator
MARAPLDPLRSALDTVGDRWKLLLVASLIEGARRFAELERELEGIAPNVLSVRLKQLEEAGLVLARPYSERPSRYSYELTEEGQALAGPLRLLAAWGAGRAGIELPAHAACGTRLEAGWYCPTCERPVPDEEARELDYA